MFGPSAAVARSRFALLISTVIIKERGGATIRCPLHRNRLLRWGSERWRRRCGVIWVVWRCLKRSTMHFSKARVCSVQVCKFRFIMSVWGGFRGAVLVFSLNFVLNFKV